MPVSSTAKEHTLNPPHNWTSLGKALDLIEKFISQGKRIAIWGHDDLDGIASTAIMLDALKAKADVLYYIPPKHTAHYGLDVGIIDELIRKQVGLIITVDGGISNHREAEYCSSLGLPLIITDHHELPEQLPQANVVVNPKIIEEGRPSPNLAGAGVSLFLASAISGFNDQGWHLQVPKRLAWASLATVSDRVPLVEDNRALLKDGIPCIAEDQTLLTIAEIIGLDLKKGLSPLIIQNSYVSLFSASISEGFRHPMVEMLLGNVDKTYLAGLWKNQQDWKKNFGIYSQKVLATIKAPHPTIITLIEKSLPPDMIGPLAGVLRDKLGWPTVVIGQKNGSLVGECRGYLPFDFVTMLRLMSHYFVQYGGHKQAAGFTVSHENLAALLNDIKRYSEQNRTLILESRPHIDVEFEADCLDDFKNTEKELKERCPFGPQNPRPACQITGALFPSSFDPQGYCWIDEITWPKPEEKPERLPVTAFLDISHLGNTLLTTVKQ